MSHSVLVVEEHGSIRLGVKRQLQSKLIGRITSCTPDQLSQQYAREHPELLILGANSAEEIAPLLGGRPRQSKVLLILPASELEAAAQFPQISAVVARETLCERLLSTVRFLLPPNPPRIWHRRLSTRACSI